MQTIFIPRETTTGETRVAATPETVKRMVQKGLKVVVESNAGALSSYTDAAYTSAGASVVAERSEGFAAADATLKLHPPTLDEVGMQREGSLLVSFLYAHNDADLLRKLQERKLATFAMELVPRISRAQKMDALSSQSNIAGYKAVILAANHLRKMFPLMMTAAGTITPARVVIIGAGVAGLQAVATAKRLGAVVDVSDIRPAVKEQVESLGGRFIDVGSDEDAEDKGGYAKEASEDFKRRQQEALRARLRECDVCITTALIPGRPAPKLVSDEMVREMPEGSVLVDLAADQGGNCTLTEPGEVVVKEGVTLVGLKNVPALVAQHASDMYAKNVLNLVLHLWGENQWTVDCEDEITAGCLVTQDGEVRHASVKAAAPKGTPA